MAKDIYSQSSEDEEMLLIRDRMELFRVSSRGVSSTWVPKVLVLTGLRKEAVASILSISGKTLDRYLAAPVTLPPSSSELLIKITELYKKGAKVLGSLENFRAWMSKPSFGLTGLIPVTLLTTASGIDLISEELGRIEFGDIA
ncbi:MAG: DUF2384 domain-containing protein [Ignavibacteriaceae bacterium]|nr:DUF2384 domain-containing protein [Ignavibacteriaceae bacterium]